MPRGIRVHDGNNAKLPQHSSQSPYTQMLRKLWSSVNFQKELGDVLNGIAIWEIAILEISYKVKNTFTLRFKIYWD